MQYTRLGRTGLKVSRLCLGTMQFGWTADRDAAFQVLDAFREAGGNFLDTADVYSRWASNNDGGVSESIIGEWLAERGCRREVVLATKVRGRMWPGPNGEGLSRVHIVQAVDDSLRRLQVDAIDLYQSHAFDADTPIEETLRAFDDLIRAGKVRYIGASNYPAWRLARALWASEVAGIARYESLQPRYNIVHRTEFEAELAPLCEEQAVGVIPYSPLQGGFLTGKYRRDSALPDTPRAARIKEAYMTERNFEIVDALEGAGRERDATIAQMAIAWLLAKPVVTSPIIGANSVEQLNELLHAVGIDLTEDEVDHLDELSARP